ncbi:LysM peptidoglycan-binding domain-containing protein [Geminisphaera colitermitum]|uniref:LysM peptidoglycan-binding domain-containing protein n=1 Tax=Geminisphaera colitermitum TaxID=1148786 RepID=UPI0001965354|nr:LysM peptidoglycan-binding domain-containing protein [Geminisphaera colitermitum]
MPMRSFSFVKSSPVLRVAVLLLVLTVTSGWWGGCERQAATIYTAEADDPNFRRGKEFAKQASNREALSSFLRVIADRGDNAPESHLELGILYQQHMKDPLSAIYHFKKFRELRPNSPQANFARQQIDACIREFARTLPGELIENQTPQSSLHEENNKLRREIDSLKDQLDIARNSALDASRNVLPPLTVDASRTSTPPGGGGQGQSQAYGQAQPPAQSSGTTYGNNPVPLVPLAPVTSTYAPPTPAPLPPPPPPSHQASPASITPVPAAPATTARGQRHVVAKGDTLYNLAQRYYGNRSRWRDILAANRDQLPGENATLRIGMELRIPQ